MSTLQLAEALGVPPRCRRAAAWLTIVCCLLPLSAGWVLGIISVTSLFKRDPGALVVWYVGFACAALGIATLWSAIVPRAAGHLKTQRLRGWQVLGLQLGGAVGLAMLTFVAFAAFNAQRSNVGLVLLWLTPIVWALVAAMYLAAADDA